ncbi:hypothetical protein LCGC14_2337540 [marine sediment metagenome]|uniref:Uncharacterized protein n=1 Tax=marine sediment metagenome TaxID=412755 RepID=A0A0F9EQR7_9ZZZZ
MAQIKTIYIGGYWSDNIEITVARPRAGDTHHWYWDLSKGDKLPDKTRAWIRQQIDSHEWTVEEGLKADYYEGYYEVFTFTQVEPGQGQEKAKHMADYFLMTTTEQEALEEQAYAEGLAQS